MLEKVLGIDFGVSYSVACVYIDGKPILVPSSEGATVYGKAFPSYVAFTKDGDLLVGEPAKKQAINNPENTIKAIKREMGTNYKVTINGKSYTPQQISAFILQKIKKDTETFLGEKVFKAVITVPAYFDDNQRTATKDAGKIAGFENIKLLNEPTAACLAYGIANDENCDVNLLVFDLGGGTLDITVLEFSDGVFEVQSTSGDTQLGGRDMDMALNIYLADEFKREYGIDLLNDQTANKRLYEAAERTIIELSTYPETEIHLPFIALGNDGKPISFIKKINRSKVEGLIEPILKRCGETIQRALDDAVMKIEDIDKVILVGESTRMPIVQNYVKDFLGKEVETGIDPTECVAQGALIFAERIFNHSDKIIHPISPSLPLSVGIELSDGTTSVIFKKGSKVPIKKTEIFFKDNPSDLKITLVQGEGLIAKYNTQLGTFVLSSDSQNQKGVSKIEITYEIDAEGIFSVSAKDLSTGFEQSITMGNII